MAAQIEQAKAALRRKAHAARAALTAEFRSEAAAAVSRHFLASAALPAHATVAGYWGIRDELGCQAILVQLMERGHTVLLPVVVAQRAALELRVWEPGAALTDAGFGTLAPSEQAPRATPDLILLPLLGFDADGTRLGYGGGYYDRTLAQFHRRPRLVGLGFAAQELDHIPRADHDIPLDAVVTELGVRAFGEGA